MPAELPLVGAAFDLASLEAHRDWVLDRQRDIELQQFIAPEVLSADMSEFVARTRTLLEGHTGRLGLHGPFVGFTLDCGDAEIRALVARRIDQALDACGLLDATQLVLHSPFRTWDRFNLDAIPGNRERLVERVHATIGGAVRRAEALGVEIVIENIEDAEPDARVALVRSFASPAVRVSLDTGHANYAHRATAAPPVDFHVHAAGDLLAHVHLQDSDGYADRHWCPGEGDVPWPAVFEALGALPRTPRLILELKDKRRLRHAASWLEREGLAC